VPAWHGTVLPRTDADLWLATAFAGYEKVVALENYLRERSGGKLTPADRDQVALALFACRADYELGARAHPERPLSGTRPDRRNNDWFRVASGKGVLLLHELRGLMGAEAFDKMMDQFGRENAGKPVSAEQFQACARKA